MARGIEELFRSHWPLVVGYLSRRTGSSTLGEELAQETFFRATRAFLGWRGGSPTAWLLAIARNVLVDEVRRGRRLGPLDEALLGAPDEQHAPIDALLGRLPPAQERLLRLVYVDGYSHREVAALTGTTPAAVKTGVWRARAALRDRLEEQ